MNFNTRHHRKNTRSAVWPDVKATLKMTDPYSARHKVLTAVGRVGDLGGSGMFLFTRDNVPVPVKAEITIDFDSGKTPDLVLTARGEVVRRTSKGVGIRFTAIDMAHLQKCILERMNR